MDNQSSQSAFNAPALSNVPEIRSFEFDKTAIGNIKSSVNKFRGSVSLPVDFITLPGREGLDLKIAALYSSSVRNTLDTWNTDAPTGILGLGWQMPIEMIALDPAGSGSSTSNAYYLISNGSANPLVKTGQTDDGKSIFQLRNFHFWSVIYDPSNQVWTIVKENGFVYTYGSGTDTQSNATQWGVRWGNWMGSSSQHAAQVRYPLAWNLASIATPMGHRIQYRYHNVDRKVTATGLAFTQASYIKQVVDSYGRTITFAYGNKYGALNPDRSHGSQPIVEYQARHTQQAEPNAYQDRYETLFLDSVDVANADGQALYGLKFTYTFVNHAPTSDSHYSLLYKRCLHSVFQYAPDGETLPGMTFEYVAQTSDVNPGALNRVVYPSGGKASFVYKKNYIASPKRLTIPNPLANSTPRVWFGPDYVVFTYAGAAGMKVVVRSWNGHWVTQDITGVMGGKTPARDSLAVLTGEHFIAVSFRNSATNSDELYLFRNDDRGTELRFGSWSMYKSQGFILALGSQSAGASTFVAGEDFVMACNKDYTAGAFQGFSFAWQTGKWNATLTRDDGAPPVPPSTSAELAAIAAFQNYYVVSSYVTASRTIRTQLYYRELDGSWRSSTSNPWSLSNVDVVTSDGQAYLAVSPMPTGIVLTYVTGSQPTLIEYSLRIFQWNESFHVINIASSGSVDLQSPVTNKQSQFEIFRTAIVGALVNNNLAMLRNVGGDQTLASSWAKKLFVAPPPTATVVAASGDDVAVLCSSSGPTQQNQLITFNPNSGIWSAPAITQSGEYASVAGDYMTVGRCIYFRGTDGTWKQLTTQLNDLNYPNSVQNHGPRYIAYQNVDGRAASTYVVALKNGGATPLARLSMEKAYVPKEQAVAGTLLSGPRFLVTYPASADSFDSAASLTLYDLDDVNLEQHVLDTPVAYVEIEDSYDSSQNYYESFFYANSAESQIVYDAAVGVAQYPMVTVVQCVKDVGAAPPQVQPQGRSEYYYSNGLAHQSTLYPAGGVQNYQNILNGIELGHRDYDSANRLVASQLDYWTVYSKAPSGSNLFGGYARCERSTSMRDGIVQESAAAYDRATGVLLWQEKSYYDSSGTTKWLRDATRYAFQVDEYARAFIAQHIFTAVAVTTKSVLLGDRSATTYVQSQVTTYRSWAEASAVTIAGSDPVSARLAPYEIYDWTTPGNTAPNFSFAGLAQTGWQLQTRILTRSAPHGLILEQVDGSGLVSSFIYDTNQQFLIAQFPNGSIGNGEVSYYGFESYEADQGWGLGSGAAVIPNGQSPAVDAHAGRRSLSIAAGTGGGKGVAKTFKPARRQRYVFAAWVKKPEGFDNAAGNASWKISVSGGAAHSLDFPDPVGVWSYVYQVIDLSNHSGSASVEVSCENANLSSNVLVDNLRFSPLNCPVQTYAYDMRFLQPNATMGANGETSRTVYDSFQQQIVSTNPADRTSKIQRKYWSRRGNQGGFSVSDPNHTLTIGSASDGVLSEFTRGSEWKSSWVPQPNVWEVEQSVLTQRSANLGGRLTCAATVQGSRVALDVAFCVRESLTAPLGIELGAGMSIQWNPESMSWHLLDSSSGELLPPVDVPAFSIPSTPYRAELDSGVVSPGLQSAFEVAGYLLPAGSTVSGGAASGKAWTLTAPNGEPRYGLRLANSQIAVYSTTKNWTLLAGASSVAFWADGRLIFSYCGEVPIPLHPTLFFGNRVAISAIATAGQPQAGIQFDDGRGLTIQTQQYAVDRMVVAQAIADNMGRQSVRTKPAFVDSAQNALFAYCRNFATMNWTSGTMSGLVSDAYPADQGYPFSRQLFETSPLARVTEAGIPGALFRVAARSTKYSYSAITGTDDKAHYLRKTTVNPNGDAVAEVSSLLDQVFCRMSVKDGKQIRNETIYDDAGNAIELRSPNYFDLPAKSSQRDWVTRQTFDYGNRLLTLVSGSLAPVRFIYDKAGNVRFTQDAQGAKAGTYNYTKYDVLSRQVESGYLTGSWDEAQLQQYADSDPAWPPTPPTWRKKYVYDGDNSIGNAIGRLTGVSANNGNAGVAEISEEFRYDVFGNTRLSILSVDAYDAGESQFVDYEYDDVGNITRVVYPKAADGTRLAVCYSVNTLNQIVAVTETSDLAKPLATFSYDAAGNPFRNVIGPADGTGVKQSYQFNSPLWLTEIRNQNQDGTDVFREALSYTEGGYSKAAYFDGTVAACAAEVGGAAADQYIFRYSYDSIGQVVNAENSHIPARNLGVNRPVTHDANGNFLQQTAGSTPFGYEYFPGLQQVSRVTNQASGTTVAEYLYDDNGNAIRAKTAASETVAAHDLTFDYDPALMLPVKVADAAPGGSTVVFLYGARNERVLKQVSGGSAAPGKKLYIRGTSAMPIMERSTNGPTADVCHIFGPGGLIAMRKGGTTFSVVKDHLGSVRAVLDASGAVVASYEYLTYGGLASRNEPTRGFMSYLYTGQEYDDELGLYNYRARFYCGELGRFLAIDLARQYFSPYLYASNNPVLFIDPTGMLTSPWALFGAIAGIILGAIEILIGVVIDVVAGVLDALTGGLATPVALGLAAFSGTFYGAGLSAITYSVFNINDNFSWKDYGIATGIGAVSGFFSGGVGEGLGMAVTSGATRVATAVGKSIAERAGQEAATFGAKAVNAGLKAAQWAADRLKSTEITAGWLGYAKGIAVGIAKSEAIGISKNTVMNLAAGNDWDKGLDQVAFSAALSGSISGLQVKGRFARS